MGPEAEPYRPWRTADETLVEQLYRWRLSMLDHELTTVERASARRIGASDAPLEALLEAARHRTAA